MKRRALHKRFDMPEILVLLGNVLKWIKNALICTFVSIMIISCSGEPHIHTFNDEWTFDEQYHWHSATCAHDAISEKEEHKWGEWKVDSVSSISRYCVVCGASQSDYALNNDYEYLETYYGIWHLSYETRVFSALGETVVVSSAINPIDASAMVGDITIPSEINGIPVMAIGNKAFYGCTNLTSVTIPDSVTSIGNKAFRECTSLISISVPDSVRSIGNEAFRSCTSLINIIVPDSVTSIGQSAFSQCSGLTSITISKSMKSIEAESFAGCTGLTSITIPDSVTSIDQLAFLDCTGLISIEIPASVKSIGDRAFLNCSGLTSLTITDSVSLGIAAFSNCTSLAHVKIPGSMTYIEAYTFDGCTGLTSITIPNSVTAIGGCAFRGCSGLTSVSIPDSVTSIAARAFYGCSGLISVSIPNSVVYIGESAFDGCNPKTIENYSDCLLSYSFSSDSYLALGSPQYLVLSEMYTGIASQAFSNCTSLISITIPNSVTRIEDTAFIRCGSLTSITIPDSVTAIGNSAFYCCNGLTSIVIPDSVTTIGIEAFYGCTGLTSITIPDSVTSIGDKAFYGCNPETVNNYTDCPLSYEFTSEIYRIMNYPQNLVLSQLYSSIRSETFKNQSRLVSITIPDSVECIEYETFSGCKNLSNIIIPDTVVSIDEQAFSYCTSLVSIVIPDSVTSIGKEAFIGCTSLTSITVPENVSIMYDAFNGCTGLMDYKNIRPQGASGCYIIYDCDEDNDRGNTDHLISTECGWRYLEAAPADLRVVDGIPTVDSSVNGYLGAQDGYIFGYYCDTSSGRVLSVLDSPYYNESDYRGGKAIGNGKYNTQLLTSAMGENAYGYYNVGKNSFDRCTNEYAARLCDILTYSAGGITYDDWFLPSEDELYLLYEKLHKKGIGYFEDHIYLSSSESDYNHVECEWAQSFSTGSIRSVSKGSGYRVRAIRAF